MQSVHTLWQQKMTDIPRRIAFILEINAMAEDESIKLTKIGIGPVNRATSK